MKPIAKLKFCINSEFRIQNEIRTKIQFYVLLDVSLVPHCGNYFCNYLYVVVVVVSSGKIICAVAPSS